MNTTGNQTENRAYRPRLALYHPNARGTGSAVRLELLPATDDAEGCIMLTIAGQSAVGDRRAPTPTYARFDWENKIVVKEGSSYSFTKVNDDLTFQAGIGTLDHCLESNANSIATLADKMSNMNTGTSSGSNCECANNDYSFTKVNDDLTFQAGIGTLANALETNAESITTLADKMSNLSNTVDKYEPLVLSEASRTCFERLTAFEIGLLC